MTMKLEEHYEIKENGNKKNKSKYKVKSIENNLLKRKKTINENFNSGVFRNNYKNYQYDYEEDFYEPY